VQLSKEIKHRKLKHAVNLSRRPIGFPLIGSVPFNKQQQRLGDFLSVA